MKEMVLGYSVDLADASHCAAQIATQLRSDTPASWLACLNPHSYAVATGDPVFSTALHAADWLIPDGVGIVIASRLLGGKIRRRVTGSDIFFEILDQLDRLGGSVFFLGASGDTLVEIEARIRHDFPSVKFAGAYSPPFRANFTAEECQAMVAAINSVKPDVLWVGMTAPKQEKWIAEHIDKLDVRFAAAIGAVFDFYVGRVRRSHPFFQRCGLEWLPRLIQEPARLWRRIFVSIPIFLADLVREKIGVQR